MFCCACDEYDYDAVVSVGEPTNHETSRSTTRHGSNVPSELCEPNAVAASGARVQSSCRCGAVRLTLVGSPVARALCHSKDCQDWAGGFALPAAYFLKKQVEIRGEVYSYRKGKGCRSRTCCAECYTHILCSSQASDYYEVCAGMMQGDFLPDAHINYQERMFSFHDGLPKLKDLPSDVSKLATSGEAASVAFQEGKNLPAAVSASCPCGAVSIDISAPPLRRLMCHCEHCCRWSGCLASAEVLYQRKSVQVRGDVHCLSKSTKCMTSAVHCCKKCGAKIAVDRASDTCGVSASLLGGRFVPDMHLFYSERRLDIRDGKPKLQDLPGDIGGTGTYLRSEGLVLEASPMASGGRSSSIGCACASDLFSAKIDWPAGGKLGMAVDLSDEALCLILGVQDEGLLACWNKICEPGKIVKPGFRLKSIQGVIGTGSELVRRLNTIASQCQTVPDEVELVFQRPAVKILDVNKDGQDLGLDMEVKKDYVEIKAVKDGVFRKFSNTSPDAVKVLDRITAVNGVADGGAKIIARMQELQAFQLQLISYASEPS
eukprot:TRINITY_DN60820_c0_g1_i1.p1 TRINITY_DN60820_c0_g1~~TRINITY_DN60820_c0_g1_i1.p1  ORF type:complete len:545 (-),score=95.54 TRINITY_DN60820_c0_g1_i1:31-1665(-)